jgi:hypothetical protein
VESPSISSVKVPAVGGQKSGQAITVIDSPELTKITRSHGTTVVPGASGSAQGNTDTRSADKVGLIIGEGIRVSTSESQLPSLGVFETESLPVEELGKSLGTVSLVDTLTTGLGGKGEHLIGLMG